MESGIFQDHSESTSRNCIENRCRVLKPFGSIFALVEACMDYTVTVFRMMFWTVEWRISTPFATRWILVLKRKMEALSSST